MNRRDLLKSMAAGAAVSAAEAMFPGVLFAPAGGAASTATAQTPALPRAASPGGRPPAASAESAAGSWWGSAMAGRSR